MVGIINFFQRERIAFVYMPDNTYSGEQCTSAVTKAGGLVQAFLGAPIIVDAANVAHRVRRL